MAHIHAEEPHGGAHGDHGHGHHAAPPPKMLTQAEMEDAFIPRNYRDRCAALLVPLNECRHASFGLPWKCGPQRLAYQKCVADDYHRRQQLALNARLAEVKK